MVLLGGVTVVHGDVVEDAVVGVRDNLQVESLEGQAYATGLLDQRGRKELTQVTEIW